MGNFITTVRKRVGGYQWVNAYRLVAADLATANSITSHIVDFERSFHDSHVEFVEAVCATVPDPSLTAFIATPLSSVGLQAPADVNLAPANIVGWIAQGAATGRTGRKFYRYCTYMDEFKASEGSIGSIGTPRLETSFGSAIGALTAAAATASVEFAIGKHFRVVVTWSWIGITECDTHHKYFDIKSEPN